MGKLFKGLVRIGVAVGAFFAVKKLSEKKNRDAVKEEYYKAKANPKAYAENLQGKVTDKAHEYQEIAKEEYSKAKENPKSYAENVQTKVSTQAKEYQTKVTEQAKHYQEVAKDEYGKVKEDPKSYAKNVRDQAKDKADEVAGLAQKGVDRIKEEVSKEKHTSTPDSDDLTVDEEGKFQSEGNVHPDEVIEAEIEKEEAEIKKNEAKIEKSEEKIEEKEADLDEGHSNIHVVSKDDK